MSRHTPWMVWCALGAAIATGAIVRPASAQERLTATIVQIEERDVFIDLGAPHARLGLDLDVYRIIEVRHPATKRVLRDRWVIGRIAITQPGATISIARLRGAPARPLAVGDVVEVDAPAPQPAPSPSEPVGPAGSQAPPTLPSPTGPAPAGGLPCPPCEGLVADAGAARRIATLENMLRERPTPRESTPEELRASRLAALATSLEMDPPVQVREGDPVELALRVGTTVEVRAVVAYVGRRGDGQTYETLPMELDGRGHARALVPSELVQPPGFGFFVQAVGADGFAVDAIARADAPMLVDVRPRRVDEYRPEDRSRVRFSAEWVSFDGTSQRDWYLDVEGDFLYRLTWHAFYGLRVGYGHYRGEGGTVDALDLRDEDPVPVGFTYGFVETELRAGEMFGFIFRTTAGLGREIDEDVGANRIRGGAQVRIRIGRERGTNLVLAAETIPEIGQRAFLGLAWESIPGLPMAAEVHVTDQPVNSGELGVRGVFEIGWRPWAPLALSARLSYQGRTIDHTGPGAGLAATFDW